MAATKPPNKNLLRALLAVTMALLLAGVATAVIRGTDDDDDDTETATGQGVTTTSRDTTTSSAPVATTGAGATTVVPAVPLPTTAVPAPGGTTTLGSIPAGAASQQTTSTTRAPGVTTTRPATTPTTGSGQTTTTFVFGRDQHPDTGEQVPLGVGLALASAGVVGLMVADGLRGPSAVAVRRSWRRRFR